MQNMQNKAAENIIFNIQFNNNTIELQNKQDKLYKNTKRHRNNNTEKILVKTRDC